ncbi:MAG: hypothetical protein QW575_04460 [Thermoproteota archaeon]
MPTQKEIKKHKTLMIDLFVAILIVAFIGFILGDILYHILGLPMAIIGALGLSIASLFVFALLFATFTTLFGKASALSIIMNSDWLPIALVISSIASIIIFYFINPPPYTPTSYSYYQGIVQGIGTGPNNNYVQFISGTTLQGNASRISNLSIGATCKLLLSQDSASFFINGTCTR